MCNESQRIHWVPESQETGTLSNEFIGGAVGIDGAPCMERGVERERRKMEASHAF